MQFDVSSRFDVTLNWGKIADGADPGVFGFRTATGLVATSVQCWKFASKPPFLTGCSLVEFNFENTNETNSAKETNPTTRYVFRSPRKFSLRLIEANLEQNMVQTPLTLFSRMAS